jgi:general secretion pathway protein D
LGGAGFTYTAFDDAGAIRAQLNALATSGDARILSSPRLLAVDNEEARIQVGTQIAVISSENTSDSVDGIIRSFTYVDTGVILSFTPTVMAGGQVRLKVSQEVSVPGPSLNNTPPINTRSVQTTLIAQSGRTIMIGGLISTTDSVSNQKVPVLGDIPLLGALFRRREVVENTTEMVILITPHIIESSLQLEALTEAFRKKGSW